VLLGLLQSFDTVDLCDISIYINSESAVCIDAEPCNG